MRIVVRAIDARRARAAQALLANAGVQAKALVGPYRPAPDGEDIAIFPAHTDSFESAAELARAARAAELPPLAMLAGRAIAAPPEGALVEFSGALALDAPPLLLAAQVQACIRAAASEDERMRRRATATQFGANAVTATASGKPRVLYIGAPSTMFLSLERALAGEGGVIAAAFSSFAGFDHLHDETFDAVVLNGAQNAPTAISLCAALRRNASLSHLPTLVITPPGDAVTADAAIERGACAVVAANAACEAPMGWLFEAVRRERGRLAAERELAALRDLIGDTRTGLFHTDAFEAHVARLAADHQSSGRPLALAGLRVMPAPGLQRPVDAAWRRGFHEMASLASRLIRETDCACSYEDELIVVALPASDLAAAKRSCARIVSVAECTAFASGEDGVVALGFEQRAVELQPGESGAGLLARALGALNGERLRA